MTHLKVILGLTAIVAGACGAGAANALDLQSDSPSIAVQYDAAKLDNDLAVQSLYRRIVFAATKVCPDQSSRSLGYLASVQACRKLAIAKAVQQIGNARLAALYAGSSKVS